MADQQDTAFVFLQRPFQFRLGIYVKMVRRLVQKKNIRLRINDLAQSYLRLLAAA